MKTELTIFIQDSVDASVASMNEKKEDEGNDMKKRESRARWIDEVRWEMLRTNSFIHAITNQNFHII